MKKEFLKILLFVWMTISMYFLYEMWVDMNWMADAIHAYLQMIVQHARQ